MLKVVLKLLDFSVRTAPKVRYAAVYALKDLYGLLNLADKEIVNEKLYILFNENNPRVKPAIFEFIEKNDLGPTVGMRIIELLKSQDIAKIKDAMRVFKSMKNFISQDKKDIIARTLSDLCKDKRLKVRILAAREIKYIDGISDDAKITVNNMLINACEDNNWQVRYNAVKTIGAKRKDFYGGDINKTIESILKLLNDNHMPVRFSAVKSLEKMRHISIELKDEIPEILYQLSESDNSKRVRTAAGAAAEKLE